MNVAAVILLGASAVTGGALWLLLERQAGRVATSLVAVMAGVPILLLGTAALLGQAGEPAGDVLFDVASVTAVAAAAATGGLIAIALLRLADRQGTGPMADGYREAGAAGGGTAADGGATDSGVATDGYTMGADNVAAVSDPRTLRGGAAIGALERIAIAVTLLAGWPEGLALVLGVKGIGRYPELGRPPASERFIIGTLGSVLWAVAAAGVVHTLRA